MECESVAAPHIPKQEEGDYMLSQSKVACCQMECARAFWKMISMFKCQAGAAQVSVVSTTRSTDCSNNVVFPIGFGMCAQSPGGQNGSRDQDGCHHTEWLPARIVSFVDFVTGYFLHIFQKKILELTQIGGIFLEFWKNSLFLQKWMIWESFWWSQCLLYWFLSYLYLVIFESAVNSLQKAICFMRHMFFCQF